MSIEGGGGRERDKLDWQRSSMCQINFRSSHVSSQMAFGAGLVHIG